MPNTCMLATDARTENKPSGSGCLSENVALYFPFLSVLLSNSVAQLQWQPLAVQIPTGFFCCVAYSRGKKKSVQKYSPFSIPIPPFGKGKPGRRFGTL